MELGLKAFNAAKYKQAADEWETALKLEPDNVDVYENLGAVYHLMERDDDAADALQKALAIRPSADTYSNLGTIRFYQGRYQDSVPAFEKTVELGANSWENWGNLADAYRWTPGDSDKAVQAYRRAIELLREEIRKDPAQLRERAMLALYLAKSGDTAAAQTELKSLAAAPKKEPATWFAMGIAYEVCKDRDHALQSLAAAAKAGQSMADLKNEPELVSLRADPRYALTVLSAAKARSTAP
jgi:serine/threonine-protein kinase